MASKYPRIRIGTHHEVLVERTCRDYLFRTCETESCAVRCARRWAKLLKWEVEEDGPL